MYAVTASEFTAAGTADILVNDYIPRWGCPKSMLTDNGRQFCSELSRAVCKMLGIRKLTTSAYHVMGNGGTERVNHTMAQMLSMVVHESIRMTGISNCPMSSLPTTTQLALLLG